MTSALSPRPTHVSSASDASLATPSRATRIMSIDALRGFVMFTMIFVNDLAGADESIVPNWMKHASDIRPRINNGMTFVDLVFPGFLFIVGLSIPFALGGRLARGERWWRLLPHVILRTASLLLLGVLMINGAPDAKAMPWHHAAAAATTSPTTTEAAATARPDNSAATLWVCFMYASALLAFCQLSPFWVPKSDAAKQKRWRIITLIGRAVGFACLAYLIFIWQKTSTDRRTHAAHVNYLFTWAGGFSIRHSWWDILGLIAWAYLVGSLMFLIFRTRRLPLAVTTSILLGFWIADRSGSFNNFALPGALAPVGEVIVTIVSAINHHVGFGEDLGSLAAITVGGVLLATVLLTPETNSTWSRVKFAVMFVAATALAAMVVYKPWGIWKNSATPAWCLWAMSITAALWLLC
jgi:predicted acyltransferase